MTQQRITINAFQVSDAASIKICVLQKLKLYDAQKDCITTFEERVKGYLSRHRELTIQIRIKKKDLDFALRNRGRQLFEKQREIPPGYPFGAPNMATTADGFIYQTVQERNAEEAAISSWLENEWKGIFMLNEIEGVEVVVG